MHVLSLGLLLLGAAHVSSARAAAADKRRVCPCAVAAAAWRVAGAAVAIASSNGLSGPAAASDDQADAIIEMGLKIYPEFGRDSRNIGGHDQAGMGEAE